MGADGKKWQMGRKQMANSEVREGSGRGRVGAFRIHSELTNRTRDQAMDNMQLPQSNKANVAVSPLMTLAIEHRRLLIVALIMLPLSMGEFGIKIVRWGALTDLIADSGMRPLLKLTSFGLSAYSLHLIYKILGDLKRPVLLVLAITTIAFFHYIWIVSIVYTHVHVRRVFTARDIPCGILGVDPKHYPRVLLRYCNTCGYNLTGLIESPCPECGAWFAIHLPEGPT